MSQISDDFGWNEDAVVVQEQAAIAVYLNGAGAVVIRQQRAWDESEDTFIVVQAMHVRIVAEAMLQTIADDDPCGRGRDSTGAERQRRYRNRNGGGDASVTGADRNADLLDAVTG